MAEHRKLRFETFSEAMAEAERVTQNPTTTSGAYEVGQILEHLARVLDVVTGERPEPSVPAPLRWGGRLVRPFLLGRPLKPGFKLPKKIQTAFWPEESVPTEVAWAHLQEAAERFQTVEPLPRHPFFGKMNRPQHETLQCRHFELHLGFIHPQPNS